MKVFMKKNISKKIVVFVFLFFQAQLFSMQIPVESETTYNVQDYEELKNFADSEERNNNLFEDLNLGGITLNQCDLSRIDLKNSFLKKSKQFECTFVGSRLNNINLKKSFISGANFIDSGLNKIDFSKSQIKNSIFSLSTINKSNFYKSVISNCRFATMMKKEKGLHQCFFHNNNLKFATIIDSSFIYVGFRNNSFFRLSLSGIVFRNCTFSSVDFTGAYMNNVLFKKCTFINCDNLDKVFYKKKIEFNFCKFSKENASKDYEKKLISRIKNFNAKVNKKPGAMKRFKDIVGACAVPVVKIGTSAIAGVAYELGKTIVSG